MGLYVKMKGGTTATTMEEARVTDMSQLSSQLSEDLGEEQDEDEAMADLGEMRVQRSLLAKTEKAQDELLRSRLSLISVPQRLSPAERGGESEVSVNRLTSMIQKVLRKQESHIAAQDATLQRQADMLARLQKLAAAQHGKQ